MVPYFHSSPDSAKLDGIGRITDQLLTKGANPNIFDAASHQTPLHRAIIAGNKPAFDALMTHKQLVDLHAIVSILSFPLSHTLNVSRIRGEEEEIVIHSFATILSDNGASAQVLQVGLTVKDFIIHPLPLHPFLSSLSAFPRVLQFGVVAFEGNC